MSKYINHIISYFFSHDVSEENASKVYQRLRSVEGDADADAAFKTVWDSLDKASLSDEEIDNAYGNLGGTLSFGRDRRSVSRWLLMAASWVVPVLMLGGAWWFYKTSTDMRQQMSEIALVQKYTANGEREKVVLPDSSVVWLNGGSMLVYPSEFLNTKRNVSLSGEAYFSVTKDASRPFTVEINHLTVRVLGTTFNVTSYPSSPETTVTLETGRVEANVEGHKEHYVLKPSEQLVYNSETDNVTVNTVNASNYIAWQSGALYFNDTPFAEAISLIERAYNVNVHVQSGRYHSQTIHARFTKNNSVRDVMDIIQMLIPGLQYNIHDKDVFIK